MSVFFDSWKTCMGRKGLPVPDVNDVNEAVEFVHSLHSAIENSGGEAAIAIGTLISSGALGELGEGALIALAGVAQTAAAFYVSQSIACLAAVAVVDLGTLFASNELPDFVVAELQTQGVDVAGVGVG
jgi:hypothetical protein